MCNVAATTTTTTTTHRSSVKSTTNQHNDTNNDDQQHHTDAMTTTIMANNATTMMKMTTTTTYTRPTDNNNDDADHTTSSVSSSLLSSIVTMILCGILGYTLLISTRKESDGSSSDHDQRQQQRIFLLYVHTFYCLLWFVTIVISCCYDDILRQYDYYFASSSQKNKNLPIVGCSVEYNRMILHVIGLLTYSTALLWCSYRLSLLSSLSSSWSSLDNHHYHHPLGETGSILLSYHMIANTYRSFFISSGSKGSNNSNDHWTIPALLLFVTATTTTMTTQSSMMMIIMNGIAYMFMIHRLMYFVTELFGMKKTSSSSSSSVTLSPHLLDTPYGNMLLQQGQSDSVVVVNDESSSSSLSKLPQNIWKLYGKEYDVTAFVPYHPGGYETIMLAANRHCDCTALFQSYHPFHIEKARAILAKYEINNNNNTTTKTKALVGDNNDNKVKEKVEQVEEEEKKSDDHDTKATTEPSSLPDVISSSSPTTASSDDVEPIAIIKEVGTGVNHKIYYINDIPIMAQHYHPNDYFYSILNQRVYDRMKEQYQFDMIRDPRTLPWHRQLWYLFILCGTAISFYGHCRGYFIGSVLLALFGDTMPCIGHDGGHYGVTRSPFWNDIAVWCIAFVTNPIIWIHQHTYGHHQFTNDHQYDPDLHHFDAIAPIGFILHQPNNKKNKKDNKTNKKSLGKAPWYFQVGAFVYIMLYFCTATFALSFIEPIRFIIDRSLFGIVEWSDRQRWGRTAMILAHFLWYVTFILVIPFYVHDNFWMAMASVSSFVIISGFLINIVTQTGHLNEYAMIDQDEKTEEKRRLRRHVLARHSWAADQIEHANNFAAQDIISFLSTSGLGLQIEHHLYPSFNHIHLLRIQPIVEQVCREYNVEYKSYPTILHAMYHMMTYMIRNVEQNMGYE